ncbi:MAG: hypothetical protein ACW98K_00670 [Candidatus Kariarchaeaceae archaeon]|jgi:hypothetical protein
MGNTIPQSVLKLMKTTLKISFILFIIASGVFVYAVVKSNPSGNYYELNANQSVVLAIHHIDYGEHLQVGAWVTSVAGISFDTENNYGDRILQLVVERSETMDFDQTETVLDITTASVLRDFSVLGGYYRVTITNLLNERVGFNSGHATATPGVVVALVLSTIMLVLAIVVFSIVFSLSITLVVLAAILYPVYLIIKSDQESRAKRKKQMQQFYPQSQPNVTTEV